MVLPEDPAKIASYVRYRKSLPTKAGLLFSILHLSGHIIFSISSSCKLSLFDFDIIDINSFCCKSIEENVIKNVGQPGSFINHLELT